MIYSKTHIAIPPGETIREILTTRDMTQRELAWRMGYTEKHISHLINGKTRLTSNTANKLEAILGMPARFWLNLEAEYQSKLSLVEDENQMDAEIKLIEKHEYNELSKLGLVPQTRSEKDRVRNLRSFYEVGDLNIIENLEIKSKIAARQLNSNSTSDYKLMASAQYARIRARDIETASYDSKKLLDLLPEIRRMTTADLNDIHDKLVSAFASCGVALVIMEHLNSSFLHGLTFKDHKKLIVLATVRTKEADRFWFSLLHEVGHILLEHNLSDKDEAQKEDEADNFARNILIPESSYNNFIKHPNYSENRIREFASEEGIDPSIILGRLQKENRVKYWQLNNLKKQYYFETKPLI